VPKKAYHLRLPSDAIEAARAIARSEGISLADVLRRAVLRDLRQAAAS
jgi:hypothetical protein